MNDALFPIVVISILLHRETLGLVQNLRMERELLLQVPLLSFSRVKTVPLCNRKKYKVTCTARSGANSAMKMFQKRDELGTSDMSTKLNTTHQNQVSEVYLFLL